MPNDELVAKIDELRWLLKTVLTETFPDPVAELQWRADAYRALGLADPGVMAEKKIAMKAPVVGWTNLYHLRPFLAGSSANLIVIRKREPEWNLALNLSPADTQFVPPDLLKD